MLFHSVAFIFGFLPICLGVFLICRRLRYSLASEYWLIACSIYFYAQFIPIHLLLFCVSIVVNFGLGRLLSQNSSKAILAMGVTFNLLTLIVFKYTGFAIANINAVAGTTIPDPGIVLPLALSFFTFQKIAYIVDVYRGGAPKYSFSNFLLFVLFYPQLIAGPICHHADLMPQIRQLREGRRDISLLLPTGILLFCVGLFKKLGIADSVAIYADVAFNGVQNQVTPDFFVAWFSVVAYTLQIYFDFSGYSDMALGLGLMFGVKMPINFLSPYKATSIIDFWRRWHMTLSNFLRDYLYIPLGGSRAGPVRRAVNLCIVMLLGGLWHGASWTFVVWGGLHGLFLLINHWWRGVKGPSSGIERFNVSAWALTMLAVMFAWVFFRAPDLSTAFILSKSMVGANGFVFPNQLAPLFESIPGFGQVSFGSFGKVIANGGSPLQLLWVPLAIAIALVLPNPYQWLEMNQTQPLQHSKVSWLPRFTPNWQWATFAFFLAMGSIVWQANTARFLYFQF